MRLIYITNARIPTEKAHGLQIMKSCEAFADAGISLELIVPFRSNTPQTDPFDYYHVKNNFKIRKLWSIDLFPLAFISRRLAFYIQSVSFSFTGVFHALLRNKHDVVFYSRDYTTLLFLSILGMRLIAEIHDYRSKKPKKAIQFILKRAKKIILNSKGTLTALQQHYQLNLDKVLIAPNSVDNELFNIKETREEARRKLGMSSDPIIMGYVGSLASAGTDKGVGDLIKAFDIASLEGDSNIALYIVGGPNGLLNKYKSMPGAEKAVFTGHVDYSKIPLYLRAIDIAVIPLSESQHGSTTSPIKLFEYMAAGKTILASNLPSLNGILSTSEASFFEPGNVQDLAQKIIFILKNPELADQLSRASKKKAEQYSWLSRAQTIKSFILSDAV